MAEIINFPHADEAQDRGIFYVWGRGDEELIWTYTVTAARNIARCLAQDEPGFMFTVENEEGVVVFEVMQEIEPIPDNAA